MRKWVIPAIIFLSANRISAQQAVPLTVEKIMRDPKWIGTSPDNVFWGTDNQTVYFSWNPGKQLSDSLYYAGVKNNTPRITAAGERSLINAKAGGTWNTDKSLLAYSYEGDIYLLEIKNGKTTRITNTKAVEFNPVFSFGGKQVVFQQNRDLYGWDKASGLISQLTSFEAGSKPAEKDENKTGNAEEKFLKAQQLELLQVIRDKKAKKDAAEAFDKAYEPKPLRSLYLQNKRLRELQISPNGRFVTYSLFTAPADARSTIVPEFVTATGFTTDIAARDKVGAPQGSFESFIYDRERDTVLPIKTTDLTGIKDQPDYVKDYTKKDTPKVREVIVNGPYWSEQGTHAIADIRSQDNKDRWIVLLNTENGTVKTLSRQRDEAWIGGPGIGWSMGGSNIGWIDENTCWFQSEATGYSHLYTANVNDGSIKPITSGNYEVQEAQLSPDKKYFYITTNEVHPGEKQFYRIAVSGGKAERITTLPGANEVTVSPDGKWIAFRYSYSNKPWELYVQPNTPGAKAVQVTNLAQSDEFKSYNWRDPQVITFTARDNQPVYARLYTPDPAKNNGAAVIFVHGAGYLQNAHKWWSSYFREYMFHNLLTDKGYTVLDMDYRGSAGYGRNWRTGIYRYMGGKDLDDEVDGAKYLAEKLQVDARRIGIYGGSYGGFMTLMALFTQPDVFASGAALRSVTDWAHYNHGYTSNILNEPFTDSIAYRRSSPIYFADGLKGKLLMCHGMVDTNVHFQDIVRLSQRLIELGKNNWELAVYPVEDHGFTTPSSWTDEYKRILLLFESTLLKR
ncbi:S9 family peptidase [Chitinophaga ginsengisegetis]|uniref:S9 family peptidase n=1 Tax=Chitinophaga ginsengisegetis TaxID=393003 RepID=UPI000DB93BA2|nr:prolyl oligopeptidase family serine peptidase [Chitinophaga ginsengisegetis]MDR6569664.1 dipeptidyl aminopeptidase/acylaminoacyl peptidase [Chitinophaga ginsengisegetis]MDR6649397.1 dipeptidyl aminopeptidase/acylaminoacyl peptidase [Chitinophaga ginsengisegetis]MDR6655747.1 dipeptidyl aminopeptidase/acylaminoacyl peptidase [Chitinophaga ginsengisegetis]